MIERWFLSHPKSVGETYGEHLKAASGFAVALALAAAACAIHALIPSLCQRTGSTIIARLNHRMVVNRARAKVSAERQDTPQPPQLWADYAI